MPHHLSTAADANSKIENIHKTKSIGNHSRVNEQDLETANNQLQQFIQLKELIFEIKSREITLDHCLHCLQLHNLHSQNQTHLLQPI